MKIPGLRLIVLAGSLAIATTPALADLLTNGGFETGDFTGWTVAAGATSVQASGGLGGYAPHSGDFYAALGNVGADGTLSQTFSDSAGDELVLSYYLASNGTVPNDFKTYIDGTLIDSLTNISPQGYTLYTFDFTATGSDTVMFGERDDPDYLALDDVSVNVGSVGAAPEPSSLALLGTALCGALGLARRRFSKA